MRLTCGTLLNFSAQLCFYEVITTSEHRADRLVARAAALFLFGSSICGRRRFVLAGLTLVDDPDFRPETFVVGVLDDFADVNIIGAEVEDVIRAGVRGKPVLPVYLFAISHELG